MTNLELSRRARTNFSKRRDKKEEEEESECPLEIPLSDET